MNAHSAAADVKSSAIDAKIASPASVLAKGRKAAGKAGLAQALFAGSRKGAASFARIMSAKIGVMPGGKTAAGSAASSLADAAAGLKGTAHAAKDARAAPAPKPSGPAPRAAHSEKSPGQKLPSGLVAAPDEKGKLILAKKDEKPEEKPDGKKKTARLTGRQAGAGAEGVLDTSKAAEMTAAQAHVEAPAANAQHAARAATAAPQNVTVHVVDLRRRAPDKPSDSGSLKASLPAPAAKESGPVFTVQQSGTTGFEPARKTAPASGAAPQSGLERLRETAGAELIRASQLVLRDGGGEIRLVLKPESLGSVRIRMNLVDNKIEGRIIVDSPAVKQVMDQNIDALSRALTAGGFQTASLEVSVGGQNADTGRRMQEPPAEARRIAAAEGFARNIPGEESLSMGDLLVNLFV